jgi:ABC-type lipoprotein export system ATPase subunit
MADDKVKKKHQNKEKDAEALLSWLGKILRDNIVLKLVGCEGSGSSSLLSRLETV